jgi:hypothetical protein
MRLPSFALGVVLLCATTCIASAALGDAARLQQGSGDSTKAKTPKKKPLSDAQIKQLLIDESIAAYSGNCPCPYNTDRRGRSCGRRSAYSREGGEAPLCYPKDVSAEMVKAYREQHPEE